MRLADKNFSPGLLCGWRPAGEHHFAYVPLSAKYSYTKAIVARFGWLLKPSAPANTSPNFKFLLSWRVNQGASAGKSAGESIGQRPIKSRQPRSSLVGRFAQLPDHFDFLGEEGFRRRGLIGHVGHGGGAFGRSTYIPQIQRIVYRHGPQVA